MPERRDPVRYWAWLVVGAVLLGFVAALIVWWPTVYGLLNDPEQVRTWVARLSTWGPAAIILLATIQTVLAPIPGQAIGAVSGYLYGPWLGTLYPMIGIAIGSFITFSLARRFGRPLAIRLVGKQSMARLDDLARRGGAPFFFLIWLVPFTPDDLACVAAGLTPMPTRQFLGLMLLGRLPGVFVSVLVGAEVAQIQPVWWVLVFVGIAIAALVLWRWGEPLQESVLRFIERVNHRLRA